MANVPNLCSRLEKWLKAHAPRALTVLNPGASDHQIASFEEKVGAKLPEDVCDWFRWRNGQKHAAGGGLIFAYDMLSLEHAAQHWENWQQFIDMNEEIAEFGCISRPDDAILAGYIFPGWLPLGIWSGTDSSYLGIDLNPGPRGAKGQVINFGRDEEEKCVGGASWGDFLEFVVDELESGRAHIQRWEDRQMMIHSYFYTDENSNDTLQLVSILAELHKLGRFNGRRMNVDPGMAHIRR